MNVQRPSQRLRPWFWALVTLSSSFDLSSQVAYFAARHADDSAATRMNHILLLDLFAAFVLVSVTGLVLNLRARPR